MPCTTHPCKATSSVAVCTRYTVGLLHEPRGYEETRLVCGRPTTSVNFEHIWLTYFLSLINNLNILSLINYQQSRRNCKCLRSKSGFKFQAFLLSVVSVNRSRIMLNLNLIVFELLLTLYMYLNNSLNSQQRVSILFET